jgi:hypothetical protein
VGSSEGPEHLSRSEGKGNERLNQAGDAGICSLMSPSRKPQQGPSADVHYTRVWY